MEINFQRSILSTFLWSNDTGIDTTDAFMLNQNLFTDDRYLIACKINEATQNGKFYGILNMELQNTSPREWLAITQQSPLPFTMAKKYHDKLPDPRGGNV